MDEKLAAALYSVHTQHLTPDIAAAAILPYDDELSAAKAGDRSLALISRGGRVDQKFVHRFLPCLSAVGCGTSGFMSARSVKWRFNRSRHSDIRVDPAIV